MSYRWTITNVETGGTWAFVTMSPISEEQALSKGKLYFGDVELKARRN